jgi:hypothetical protein
VKWKTKQLELDLAKVKIEAKRPRIEENRDARLQRREDGESQADEMRIEAKKAQKSLMMKMIQMMICKEL